MNSRTAFLFSGEGAYLPGGLSELAEVHPQIISAIRTVDEVALQYARSTVTPLLLGGGAPSVSSSVEQDSGLVQLAIYATSIAVHQVLTQVHDVRPDVLMGHGIGELAALTVAGGFEIADGARMLMERMVALDRAGVAKGGLLCLHTNAKRAAAMITAAGVWRTVIAAENAPCHTMVSGPSAELTAVEAIAKAAGVVARWSPATYPFHNQMLRRAAEVFAEQTSAIPARSLCVRVYSPVLGRYYGDDDDLHASVASHLVWPVRFDESVRTAYADGVSTFVECGPRSILTDLAGQNLPGLRLCAPLRRLSGAAGFAEELAKILHAAVPAPTPVMTGIITHDGVVQALAH